MIEIIEHRKEWPSEYAQIASALREQLGGIDHTLHHIGSTAVPGLAAKDIIDIQLSVSDLDEWSASGIELEGFQHIPNLSDHCPPGMTLDAQELDKRFYKTVARPTHLHVREMGRFNQRYALLCRDFLREHRAAALAYADIKRALAERFPDDQASYYAVKDPTFDLIMVAAEAWAASTGWQIPPED